MGPNRKRFFQCFRSLFIPSFATACLAFRLNDQQNLEISYWTIILTHLVRLLALGSFFTGWAYKVMSHQHSQTILELSPLLKILGFVELLVSLVVYVNVSISMEFQKQSHVELFSKAFELDKISSEKFNLNFSFKQEIRKNKLNTRILMLYCGVFYTITFICLDPDWRVVLMAIGYAIFTMGPWSINLLHISLMDLLRVRLGLLQELLRKYISLDLNQNKEQQRQFVALINHFRKYCELIHDVNEVYGHTLMVNYFHDFTQTSCIVFELCHMALQSESSNLIYLLLLMFVLPRMFKIVYMAGCARWTILELRSCVQVVATFDDYCSSDEARKVVDELIMWIQLNRFQFNVGNALQLNFGLVYAFFLGVGNYVLILIQLKFQETSIIERLDLGAHKKQ